MQTVTRQDAQAKGLTRYFTGTACKRGHIAERNTATRGCLKCAVIHATAYNRANPKIRAAAWKRYAERHPEKCRESSRRRGWKRDGLPAPTRPRPATCEACNDPPGGRALALDHDHETGAFRGWLCDRCNFALGQLRDDPKKIRALLAYLLQGA